MIDGWTDELTIEFARELVARADPDEVAMLDAIAPAALSQGAELRERSDGSLGFGIELVSLASIALPVAKAVGTFLLTLLSAGAVDAVSKGLTDQVRSWFKRGADAEPLPAEVVDKARKVAFEHSITLGLEDSQATLLADAVAGALTSSAVT
jgi:hypothetical protein